ncbi:MAG TPA: histidine triad nucleotide-binding protein [Candidatus Udaeobacter sp.]|jgi:histidine triad (HIT) family protein|nr:histidine triad nucleotide-binding protein [Candidatus Udaeobacter sp.]
MRECLFCGIIEGKIKGDIVYRDDSVVAFKDIKPKAPVHILIIPRKHIATLGDVGPDDGPLIAAIFFTAAKLAQEHSIADTGYRVVVNCGANAGQTVFHLHYHLMGGRHMGWPPG